MKHRIEIAAQDLAASCLLVVRNLLYEWEVKDAEAEFYSLILAKFQELGITKDMPFDGDNHAK